jgi:hypothetical protein
VSELLNLFPNGFVGGLADTSCAICIASGHSDQKVVFGPIAFGYDLAQLVEIYLELVRTMAESSAVLNDVPVGLFAEPNEIGPRAIKAIAERLELQPRQQALELLYVIGVFWANEQVHINEATLSRSDIEPKFDIRAN